MYAVLAPLGNRYYACLCGHLDVVQYLLENGARCDASTFDGERCIYGALTDQIRKVLLDCNVLTSSAKRREPFQEFLRRLFEDASLPDAGCRDRGVVNFAVRGVDIGAHRFFLAARSPYFAQQLHGRWRSKSCIRINHQLVRVLSVTTFEFYFRYPRWLVLKRWTGPY